MLISYYLLSSLLFVASVDVCVSVHGKGERPEHVLEVMHIRQHAAHLLLLISALHTNDGHAVLGSSGGLVGCAVADLLLACALAYNECYVGH
jgi:hypothetical protein